jgi:hypothetical protein
MADENLNKLNALIEQEKNLIRKMNVAMRAGANQQILGQFNFMLEECRLAQFELRELNKTNNTDDKFDGFLSIG